MEPHSILGFFHFNPEPMSISFYCINRLESSKTKKKRYGNTHPGLFLPLWVMVMECNAVNPPPMAANLAHLACHFDTVLFLLWYYL